MNLFKRFLELVPGADPLLVGTVTAMTSTTPPGYVGGGHRHSARCRGSHRQEGILQVRGAGRGGAGLTDL